MARRENKNWVLNPDAMLVAAVLIATLAATTFFTVPGGFEGSPSTTSYRGMGSFSGGPGTFEFNATQAIQGATDFGSANLLRNKKTDADFFFGFTAASFLVAMVVVIMLSIGCNHRLMLHFISILLMSATACELQAILIIMNVVHPVLHKNHLYLMAGFLGVIFASSLLWLLGLCFFNMIPPMPTVPELLLAPSRLLPPNNNHSEEKKTEVEVEVEAVSYSRTHHNV